MQDWEANSLTGRDGHGRLLLKEKITEERSFNLMYVCICIIVAHLHELPKSSFLIGLDTQILCFVPLYCSRLTQLNYAALEYLTISQGLEAALPHHIWYHNNHLCSKFEKNINMPMIRINTPFGGGDGTHTLKDPNLDPVSTSNNRPLISHPAFDSPHSYRTRR